MYFKYGGRDLSKRSAVKDRKSIRDAARKLSINQWAISGCCNGKCKTTKGCDLNTLNRFKIDFSLSQVKKIACYALQVAYYIS